MVLYMATRNVMAPPWDFNTTLDYLVESRSAIAGDMQTHEGLSQKISATVCCICTISHFSASGAPRHHQIYCLNSQQKIAWYTLKWTKCSISAPVASLLGFRDSYKNCNSDSDNCVQRGGRRTIHTQWRLTLASSEILRSFGCERGERPAKC